MTKTERIERTQAAILREGVVVAVRLSTGEGLREVCEALARGGLRAIELTLTTPGAVEAIRAYAGRDGWIVGGGTVLSASDAERVAAAGGRFAFSPVVDATVIAAGHDLGLLTIPGAASPTEILAAHRAGARMVKVFPSGALGGPGFLRAVRGPLPDIPLIPTSGPTADDLGDYIAAGAVAVGAGGMELFPPGFTPAMVESAARRVRAAYDTAVAPG